MQSVVLSITISPRTKKEAQQKKPCQEHVKHHSLPAGPEGNNSTCQGQPQRPPSKQLRQQNKQRQTPVATPASKHTPAASAASSAVQLLKDELAQKLHAAVQRASPGVKVCIKCWPAVQHGLLQFCVMLVLTLVHALDAAQHHLAQVSHPVLVHVLTVSKCISAAESTSMLPLLCCRLVLLLARWLLTWQLRSRHRRSWKTGCWQHRQRCCSRSSSTSMT